MDRKQTYAVGAAAVVAVGLLGGYFVWTYVLPESATYVDEPAQQVGSVPGADGQTANDSTSEGAGPVTLETGTFTGKDGHSVSGTVELKRDDEGYYLRFENYSQTQGPDVFLYLTPAEDPDEASEIDAGLKVTIDGGADGGEMTKVGNFTQRLPDDFDPDRYDGVAVWCDAFGVPFGAATLMDA